MILISKHTIDDFDKSARIVEEISPVDIVDQHQTRETKVSSTFVAGVYPGRNRRDPARPTKSKEQKCRRNSSRARARATS